MVPQSPGTRVLLPETCGVLRACCMCFIGGSDLPEWHLEGPHPFLRSPTNSDAVRGCWKWKPVWKRSICFLSKKYGVDSDFCYEFPKFFHFLISGWIDDTHGLGAGKNVIYRNKAKWKSLPKRKCSPWLRGILRKWNSEAWLATKSLETFQQE